MQSGGKDEQQGKPSQEPDDPRPPAESTSVAEWIVAALGGLLLMATIGYIAYHGLANPDRPPNPVVEVVSTEAVSGGFLVRFQVINAGNATAAGLLVSGELMDGDQAVEESETTIDYVPHQSSRRGGLFFRHDPAVLKLRLRAQGYTDP